MTGDPAPGGAPAAAGPRLGRGRARLQGGGVLALLAASGLALWQLSALAELPPHLDWSPCGEHGALAIISNDAPRVPGAVPEARVLISRRPIAFDPRHSVITFLDRESRRVIPVDAAMVLAGEDGRLVPFRNHLVPAYVLDSLRMVAPASRCATLRAWLADPSRPRNPLEDPLRRLLEP